MILFRQGASNGFGALPPLVWPRFAERDLLSLPSYHTVARVVRADGTPRLGRLSVPRPMGGGTGAADHVRLLTRVQLARPRSDVEREVEADAVAGCEARDQEASKPYSNQHK